MVHIRRGKPIENAHCESFSGRMSEEFLNSIQFRHLLEAKSKTEIWLRHYNDDRLHSDLAYRTPNEFTADCLAWKAKRKLEMTTS